MPPKAQLLLALCILSCQTKRPEPLIGAVYYEAWVFVGRDETQTPLMVSLSIRKSQQNKKQVELESKLFMSKAGKTRQVFREKKTVEGDVREVSIDEPISLKELPCDGETCPGAEISRDFLLRIEGSPLQPFAPHAWHDSRVGDAITRASLSLNQTKANGCLFVERGVSLARAPEPFFGDFDWVALLDEEGGCWIASEGTRVGGFALSLEGRASDEVTRQGRELFLDKKSGQEVPAAWSFEIPQLSLKAQLSAQSGHRGEGNRLPSGRSAFFGQGVVEGRIQVSGEDRQCIGWIQHIKDE